MRILLVLAVITTLNAPAQERDTSLLSSADAGAIEDRKDQTYLMRHNPFYFAYGNPVSKLQLSFRTKLLTNVPIYFAYTQLMFWALQQDSKPFSDMTFNPELFYRLSLKRFQLPSSLDLGWMHNSNGKAGAVSRSYNSVYLRFNTAKEFSNWIIRFSLTGAYHHSFDDGNRDIQTYVGPVTFKIGFVQLWHAWVDKTEIALQAVPGGKFAQNLHDGGYQASASFRLGGIDLTPSFYLQYYTGYAESLLNYDQYVHAFRAGILF